jgi:hypothetical protein
MKTALRVSGKGYLFAYNPNAVDNVEVPLISATASTYNGEVPLLVQFNAAASVGNPPLSFLWHFGDGSTSILQNPLHNFLLPGTYTVQVTVTDADGDTGNSAVVITVNDVSTGIEEKMIPKPEIFPVPSSDYIFLKIPEGIFAGNSLRISILDLSCRYVLNEKSFDLSGNQIMLDIADITEGIYVLRLSDKKTNYNLIFIKVMR